MSRPVSKKDLKRTRVLEAAKRRFGRHGIRSTTMQDIAAEAGVAVGTIYRFFPDKDSLILAWVDEHRQLLEDQFSQAVTGSRSAPEKLRLFLCLRFAVVRQVREEPALGELTRAVHRLAPQIVPEMTETVRGHILSLLEEGRRAGEFPSVRLPQDAGVLLLALSGFFSAADDTLSGPASEEGMLQVADWFIGKWQLPCPLPASPPTGTRSRSPSKKTSR